MAYHDGYSEVFVTHEGLATNGTLRLYNRLVESTASKAWAGLSTGSYHGSDSWRRSVKSLPSCLVFPHTHALMTTKPSSHSWNEWSNVQMPNHVCSTIQFQKARPQIWICFDQTAQPLTVQYRIPHGHDCYCPHILRIVNDWLMCNAVKDRGCMRRPITGCMSRVSCALCRTPPQVYHQAWTE